MPQRPLLPSDLAEVSERLLPLVEDLKGARILVTGGTGFVGTWLVESLLHLDRCEGLTAKVLILSRNPEAYAERTPHLALDPRVEMHYGQLDGCDPLSRIEGVTHLIHAGSDVNRPMTPAEALSALRTLDQGTEGLLQAAERWPLRHLLYISSAAVYDRLPKDHRFQDDHQGSPPIIGPESAYSTGKRVAELRTCLHASMTGYTAVMARVSAQLGPLVPMDGGFAAGNFIADALAGRRIRIMGDGTNVRSYQYPADLAVWLWTLLLRAPSGEAYNVGGDNSLNLRELAELINEAAKGPGVNVLGVPNPDRPVDIFAPPVRKAMEHFGLSNRVGIEEAVRRTLRWSSGQAEAN